MMNMFPTAGLDYTEAEMIKEQEDLITTLSIMQHHDAITGTATDNVVNDYAAKMHSGLSALWALLTKDAAAILNTELHSVAQRPAPKSLAVPDVLNLKSGKLVEIVSWNSTPRRKSELLRNVIVDTDAVCIKDGDKLVPVQINVSERFYVRYTVLIWRLGVSHRERPW